MALLLGWTLILLSDKEHYSRGVAGRLPSEQTLQPFQRRRVGSVALPCLSSDAHCVNFSLISPQTGIRWVQSEAFRPDQTSCCHRHVSVRVLMSEFASFLFLAGINLLSSSIGCPLNRNEEPNWSILCKNIPILLLFPPRKWASAAATGWSQPEGEEKEGNRKFNFATERPCGCCNHHRCTTHFYWRVFHPSSRQMCLRDAAGKVLSCKNVGKKATNLGCLFYQFIYLFILPSFESSLRENGTTWQVHPLQCCGSKDMSAKKLHLLCLSVYLLALSWNLNNVTLFSWSLKGGSLSHN